MESTTRTYADLPDEVVEFLSDIGAVGFVKDFSRRYGATSVLPLEGLADDVALGNVSLASVPDVMLEAGIAPEKAHAAAAEFARVRLLPMASVVGNVAAMMTQWGGAQVNDIPSHITPEAFARLFLADRDDAPVDEFLRHRLELALVSLATGVRTQEQTAALLERPTKVGGLAMSQEAAQALVREAAQRIQMMGVGKDMPAVQQTPAKPLGSEPASKVSDALPFGDPFASRPSSQNTSAPAPVSKSPEPLQVNPGLPFGDPFVVAEVKEISPQKTETVEVKKAPPLNDLPYGDPFNAAPTAKVSTAPTQEEQQDEQELGDHAQKAKTLTANAQIPDGTMITQRVIDAVGWKPASDDLKRRFQKIIEARVANVRDAVATRDALEKSVETGGIGISGGMLANIMERLEQLVEAHEAAMMQQTQQAKQSHVDTRAAQRTQTRAPRVSLVQPEVMEAPQQTAAAPKPPARKAIPSTPSGRPRVVDIQGSRTLAGPVEELARMTIIEFRRLSRDPVEAARKLASRISLLEERGFEKRIAGIKGWRSSPLYRAYLELTQEALSEGVRVEEMARRLREEGRDTLTAPELAALTELNAQLRF